MPAFNFFDLFIIGMILIGSLQGWKRGLSGEFARIFSFIAALAVGWYFYYPAGDYLASNTRLEEPQSHLFGFILVVAATWIGLWMLRLILRNLMEWTFKERLERWGGVFVGVLRMTSFIVAMVLIVSLWRYEILYRLVIEDSIMGNKLHQTFFPPLKKLLTQHPHWPIPSIPESPVEHERNITEGYE